jgi:FtsP/CotA-like multicopper oxidase with cupredoxin domain
MTLSPRGLSVFALTLPLTLVRCGAAPETPPFTPRPGPSPWAADLRVAAAADRDPAPRLVEVSLEARMADWEYAPGRRVRAMTYNGQVPGPLIEARAGDTLVVHFTNRLDEPTTIHWHGLRVPANMDGAPHSQEPVAPGATFEYRFTVPDAGTFWYHPHVHESVQMERGLYGPIIVRGAQEPAADVEGVLVLDDLLLGADGQIAPTGDLLEQHNGREGGVSLVNGRAGAELLLRAGQRQRWRIVNAGSARFYRLALPGHRFTVVGTDGGPVTTPHTEDELMLVPGDRLDVLVDGTGSPGTTTALRNLPYARGHGAGLTEAVDLLRVRYVLDAPVARLAAPTAGARIEPLATNGVAPRTVTFHEFIDRDRERVVFTINGRAYPDVPDVMTRVGATEVWDLVNESEMEHPFHLHGFFFQVLSRNGVAASEPAWEDTLQLRGMERVRIAFRVDDRPGHWMYHCHILEHVDNGMMAALHVTR